MDTDQDDVAGLRRVEARSARRAARRAEPSFSARLVRAVVAVLLLLVVPALVGLFLAGVTPMVGAAAGSAIGVLMCASAGRRWGLRLLPLLALGALLGALTAGGWWWVLVVAALAAAAGAATAFGLGGPVAFVALVAVVSPAQSTRDALLYALFALAGGLYGWLLAGRLGVPPDRPLREAPWPVPLVVAVFAGVVVGASAAIAIAFDLDHGYWIPMTALVLLMTTVEAAGERFRHRLVGTALGLVVLIPVLLVLPGGALPRVAGLVAVTVSLAVASPYWLKTMLGTVAVVLLIAPPQEVAGVAERRLLYTLIGAAVLYAGVAVVRLLLPEQRPPDQGVGRLKAESAELETSAGERLHDWAVHDDDEDTLVP